MNIGYIHHDVWPPNRGDRVYSWEIFSRLQKRHSMYIEVNNPLPGGIKVYKNLMDSMRFARKIDVLLINIEGYFNFHVEKFAAFRLLNNKLKIVTLTQAPIEESLLFGKSKASVVIEKYVRRVFGKLVDANICVSENMRKYCVNELKIANSYIIPNGVDTNVFCPDVKPISHILELKGFYKVFWTGPSEFPWQGVDTLIKVAKAMRKYDKKVLFFIITSHRPSNFYEQLDNVIWIHAVNNKDLPRYLISADVCLCLYHELLPQIGFYNSSIKLFSYMSMAKPIIASSVGQITSVIVTNKNGLLTNGSVADIVKKILKLKNNKKEAAKLGSQARKDVIQYYNWDRAVDEIEAILHKVST